MTGKSGFLRPPNFRAIGRRRLRRGVVLLITAVMCVVLIAVLGVSVDMGRMFVIKHEAQVFTDSAALAAALQLDGTSAGIARATQAVEDTTNKWNMGTQRFSGSDANYTATFSRDANGPWAEEMDVPADAAGYVFVKVTAALAVPVYFIGIVVPVVSTPVNAMSVATQKPDTTLYRGGFPFTPMAFPGASTANPALGFTINQQYTIRYPAGAHQDPCPGDIGVHTRDNADRGYWGDSSADIIRRRIVDDYQSGATVTVGQPIGLSGGAKTTEAAYVNERSSQDLDQTSFTLADYLANPNHNGRRLVTMPITDYTTGIALGYGAFLLLPAGSYDHTGNSAWCAIYVGPAVEGAINPGGGGSGSGSSHVRLVK